MYAKFIRLQWIFWDTIKRSCDISINAKACEYTAIARTTQHSLCHVCVCAAAVFALHCIEWVMANFALMHRLR